MKTTKTTKNVSNETKQLITINTNGAGQKAVSSRELYNVLGLARQHYTRWVKYNITENKCAEEGKDYVKIPTMGKNKNEFVLNLDFAKELCLVARTEQAKKIRQYFINSENKAQNFKPLPNIKELAKEVTKELNGELEYFAIVGYAKAFKGIKTLTQGEAVSLGMKAKKISNDLGYPIDTTPHPAHGKVNTYHTDILEKVFANYVRH